MSNQINTTNNATDEMSLEDKLEAIQAAMQDSGGDMTKQIAMLEDILDPQEALNCEGCQ